MEKDKEIATLISKEFGIPYVDLEGIDIEICKEIIYALKTIQEILPEILKSFCAIGTADYITEQVNLVANSDAKEEFVWHETRNNHLLCAAVVFNSAKTKIDYLAILLPEYLKSVDLEYINYELEEGCIRGKYPANCKTFSAMIFHEVGHALDLVLKVSENEIFKKIIDGVDLADVISKQAAKSPNETVADAFAEYLLNPEPNEVICKIVELINYLYYEQIVNNPEEFDISNKYKYFK